MPSCTGNPEQRGVWVCPYCRPGSTPISCYSMQDLDPYDSSKGQVNVACQAPCTFAGFHGRDPGLFWEHVQETHGWDGKKLDEAPHRYLDDWTPPPTPTKRRFQRGPSKATRAKARAQRKKKKKRR